MARILVVDDEELARFTMRTILESAGHEIDEAGDGEVGVSMIKKHRYEVVLLDIVMPKQEGLGTIIELKKDYPDQKIIAVSGGGRTKNQNYLRMASSLGVDETLAKPFTEAQLLAAVNQCLA